MQHLCKIIYVDIYRSTVEYYDQIWQLLSLVALNVVTDRYGYDNLWKTIEKSIFFAKPGMFLTDKILSPGQAVYMICQQWQRRIWIN